MYRMPTRLTFTLVRGRREERNAYSVNLHFRKRKARRETLCKKRTSNVSSEMHKASERDARDTLDEREQTFLRFEEQLGNNPIAVLPTAPVLCYGYGGPQQIY